MFFVSSPHGVGGVCAPVAFGAHPEVAFEQSGKVVGVRDRNACRDLADGKVRR